MSMDQDQIFAASEADAWFERNKAALSAFRPEDDLPLRALALYDVRPRRALEVGASVGARLAHLAEKRGAKAVAVEPSGKAIAEGRAKFPKVEFIQAGAKSIPLQETFDLVIINYVFHWMDRGGLMRSASELDRLLADQGFLLIGDFFPSNRLKVDYHHRTDQKMFTYKQNYADLFLSTGLYRPVCLLTGGHGKGLAARTTESERTAVWLLQKDLQGHYADGLRPA